MATKRKKEPASPFDALRGLDARLARAFAQAKADPESLPGYGPQKGNPRDLAPRLPATDDWVNDQLNATAASADKWKRNVMRPKKDPIVAAKKAAGKWKNKVQEAITNDAFAKGLDAVDEAAMLETLEATPATAVSEGVNRRKTKIRTKVDKVRNLVIAGLTEVDRMPVDTEAQRDAKMIANLRMMRGVGKAVKS